MYDRPSKDAYYINIALAISKRSTCLKRHYGAIIVNKDEIVSTGYNGNPRGIQNCCDKGVCKRLHKLHNTGDYSDCQSVHAEQNALLSASRKDIMGGTLYLACEEAFAHTYVGDAIVGCDFRTVLDIEPCPICKRMIDNAGIVRVVVPAAYGGVKCL